tara:strand:- start:2495 stop:3250 length:756 start_codon:yes stop_codon:yes gene_type:complete
MYDFSIIIPTYNEYDSLPNIIIDISKIFKNYKIQILVIDDNSTDNTHSLFNHETNLFKNINFNKKSALITFTKGENQLTYIKNKINYGKGYAIKLSQKYINSKFTVIQDADYEYDPNDLNKFIKIALEKRDFGLILGKRFFSDYNYTFPFYHYLANKFLSNLFSLLYNQKISDIEVGYKFFKSEIFKKLEITKNDFGIEIELISKYLKLYKDKKIIEININYFPRTFQEGKKIKFKDGILAIYYILYYRFF